MSDLYLFLGGFMVTLALIGFAFTAGRNYEKRQLRKRTVNVAGGRAIINGVEGEIPPHAVVLGIVRDKDGNETAIYAKEQL